MPHPIEGRQFFELAAVSQHWPTLLLKVQPVPGLLACQEKKRLHYGSFQT